MKSRQSCADDQESGALSVEQARQRIAQSIRPPEGWETLPIRAALGRVLARDLPSPCNVPAHDNSAMDGYALAGAELPASGTRRLQVVGTSLAGRGWGEPIGPGQCVRIMTGAVLPEGADTVVMQEQADRERDHITIGPGHRPGQNLRRAGEDLALGQLALAAGKRLGPAELGLLASLGTAEVSVRPRPRVAFFSTGDELRSIGEHLEEGEVFDSNRYTLFGMLSRLEVVPVDLGVIPDDPEALREAFRDAAAGADAIITSGGVSVGEADYVKSVLGQLGQVDFWKIAMKPGRPLAFGLLGGCPFFGLPGNPVAVMVTFYQFVQPALRQLAGEAEYLPRRFSVPCRTRLKKRPGRTEFQRGRLEPDGNGGLSVSLTGKQGSGILSSMSLADCFIVLPPENTGVEAGDPVLVEPFQGLV
jgi:molybdopterin molybdotransferase